MKKYLFSLFLICATNASAFQFGQDCITLQGIEFQKIDTYKFLASKNGKNLAFVTVSAAIPEGVVRFRFFSEKLCDSFAESEFQMNEKLIRVDHNGITFF